MIAILRIGLLAVVAGITIIKGATFAPSKGCMKLYPKAHGYGASELKCYKYRSCPWTSATCRDACTKISTCMAVDWNGEHKGCWKHSHRVQPHAASYATNLAHYSKFRKCSANCGLPPRLQHATVRPNKPIAGGKSAIYTCKNGYQFADGAQSKDRECLKSFNWEQFDLKCKPAKCKSPKNQLRVRNQFDMTRYKAEFHYRCAPGYEKAGKNVIKCISKKWNGEGKVKCNPIHCSAPPKLPHAEYRFDKKKHHTTYRSLFKYECKKGYAHSGRDKAVVCQADKKWKGDVKCDAACANRKLHQMHAISSEQATAVGRSLKYRCNKGFEFVGKKVQYSVIKCMKDQTWDGLPPKCKRIHCGAPKSIKMVTKQFDVKKDKDTYESMFRYTCKKGFMHGKDSSVKCTYDKTWKGTIKCVVVNCGKPPSYPNSNKKVSKTTYMGQVSYICANGFDAASAMKTFRKTCSANKKWEPSGKVECKKSKAGGSTTGDDADDSLEF